MTCNFCDKKGFVLFPVRPAIVPGAANAPALPEEIMAGVPAKGHMMYTCRQLRPGYLYVFDEKRDCWTDYIVTQDGYFWRIAHQAPVIKGPVKLQPCMGKKDEVAKSTFITLPVTLNPKGNGIFWFGWSDYPWTENVRNKNNDPATRKKHMQDFDLQAWLDNKKAPQTVALDRLQNVVAEFAAEAPVTDQMTFMSAQWMPKDKETADVLIATAHDIPGQPPGSTAAILAIPDPVAVTRDLVELLSKATEKFHAQCRKNSSITDFDRRVALNAMITGMEYNVKKAYQISKAKEANRLKMTQAAIGADTIDNIVNKNLDVWAGEEWKRYQTYYKETERQKFLKEYNIERDKFNQQYATPLGDMYLKCLSNSAFIDYLINNYDTKDIEGGVHYSQLVALCLLGGQQEGKCFSYYEKLLQGNVNDEQNPIMRAMVLNNDEIAQVINKHAPGSLTVDKLTQIPWFSAFTAAGAVLAKLSEKIKFRDVILPLHAVLAGPIAKMLALPLTSNTPIKQIPVILGIHAEAPVVFWQGVWDRYSFSKALTGKIVRDSFDKTGLAGKERINKRGEIRRQAKQTVRESGILDFIENDMRLKAGDGIDLKGKTTYGFLLLLSDDVSTELEGKTPQEKMTWWDEKLRNIASGESLDNMYLKRGMLVKSASVNFISLLFQGAAIASMIQTEAHWYGGVKSESSVRLSASWAGLVGGAMELSVGASKLLGFQNSVFLRLSSAEWVALVGRWLGLAGGVILAFCDLYQAIKQANDGHFALAGLYIISFSAVLAFSILAYLSASFFILIPLAIVMIVITFVINYYIPNDLMKWLERTLWGLYLGEKYTSTQEVDEFTKLWEVSEF